MQKQLLNKSVLEAWKEVDPTNWRVLVEEIIRMFFETSVSQLDELKKFWSQKDLEKVSSTAHFLKSSFGNVGAEEMETILGSIEKKCEDGNLKELGELFQTLENVHGSTIDLLVEFRKKNQAA